MHKWLREAVGHNSGMTVRTASCFRDLTVFSTGAPTCKRVCSRQETAGGAVAIVDVRPCRCGAKPQLGPRRGLLLLLHWRRRRRSLQRRKVIVAMRHDQRDRLDGLAHACTAAGTYKGPMHRITVCTHSNSLESRCVWGAGPSPHSVAIN
jgi:hypothetical protein